MVTIVQAAAALRAKQISSVELTDEALARIPGIEAFLRQDVDEASALDATVRGLAAAVR